jgi:competence protein ComEC
MKSNYKILIFYVVLIGAPASAVRASLMAGICLVAPALGRRPDSIAAWSVAVFVVYASRPGLFFDAGCALSFTVMLGILVWLKWSVAFARPACLGVWHVRLRTFTLYRKSLWLAEGWGVTFAAWVAGAPLVARLFGLFAWSGLIANVLAMRFAALTVAFGFAGLLAGFAGTPAAVAFNLLAALSTRLLTLLSALFAALPGASSAVRPWTLLECAAWYGFFVLALLALEAFWPKRQEGQDEWWLLG